MDSSDLVKHFSFKEEEECRIINIKKLSENDNTILDEKERMYINYLDIREHVKKVIFAPQAEGYRFFKDKLAFEGLYNIECVQSKHPFKGK